MASQQQRYPSVKVAVLIATRDRSRMLRRTLESLCAMETAGLNWVLWVADNGSTDETQSVLETFRQRLPLHSVVVEKPGKNAALNVLLDHAVADLHVFTDDDVLVDPQWLAEFTRAAQEHRNFSVFAGRILPQFPPGSPSWITDHSYRFADAAFARFDCGENDGQVEREPFGPSFALRAMSGLRFDESVGPDGRENYICGGETELLKRLRRAGESTWYVAKAKVGHVVRSEQLQPEWLNKRAFRLGRGNAYISPANGHRLFNVPWSVLRSLAWAWLRWRYACWLGSTTKRIYRSETYFHRLGQFVEYRGRDRTHH